MTSKADYTDEEWAVLTRSPVVAGFAITLADPGGPIELTKESLAAMRAAAAPPSDDELLVAVSQAAMAQRQARHNPIKDLDLKSATGRQQIVDDLKRVNEILTAKATPEEAASFRAWLMEAAQEAANAAAPPPGGPRRPLPSRRAPTSPRRPGSP